MPVYTVYAFWGADTYFAVFNAVAAIMGGNDFWGLVRSVAIVGLIVAAVAGLLKLRMNELGIWLTMLVIFYGGLFLPRVTVSIVDQRIGNTYTVDNVPLGLAFFSATTSHIGSWLTETFETNFSAADEERFSKTGMVFGARLVEQLQYVKMQNPTLFRDQTQFLSECINPEIINRPGLYNDLFKSRLLWSKLGEGDYLNPGRITSYTDASGNTVTANCYMAYHAMHNLMLAEATRRLQVMADKYYPGDPLGQAKIATSIEHVESNLLNTSRSAQEAILQGMTMNLFIDGQQTAAAMRNDPQATQIAAAVAMAEQSASVSYGAMAKIAENTLPRLRVALELVVIALFPIIFVLVIAAGEKGGFVLKTYLMSMAWLQLWAPLYAVLNFLAWSSDKTGLKIAAGGAGGANMETMHQLSHQALSSQSITSMLTVAIPVIAYAIVKGGEVAGTSVASSVMSPAQGAAQRSGDAVGQGNISAGNVQWGNVAAYNTSAGNAQLANASWNNRSWNNEGANKSNTAVQTEDNRGASFSRGGNNVTAVQDGGPWEGAQIAPNMKGSGWSLTGATAAGVSGGAWTPQVQNSDGRQNAWGNQQVVQAQQSLRASVSEAQRTINDVSNNRGFQQAFSKMGMQIFGVQDSLQRTGAAGTGVTTSEGSSLGENVQAQTGGRLSAGGKIGGGAGGGGGGDGGGILSKMGRAGNLLQQAANLLPLTLGASTDATATKGTSADTKVASATAGQATQNLAKVKAGIENEFANHSDATVRSFGKTVTDSIQKVIDSSKAYEAAITASNSASASQTDTKGAGSQMSQNTFMEGIASYAKQNGISVIDALTASSSGDPAVNKHVQDYNAAKGEEAKATLKAPEGAAGVAAQGLAAATSKPSAETNKAAVNAMAASIDGGPSASAGVGPASPSAEGGGAPPAPAPASKRPAERRSSGATGGNNGFIGGGRGARPRSPDATPSSGGTSISGRSADAGAGGPIYQQAMRNHEALKQQLGEEYGSVRNDVLNTAQRRSDAAGAELQDQNKRTPLESAARRALGKDKTMGDRIKDAEKRDYRENQPGVDSKGNKTW